MDLKWENDICVAEEWRWVEMIDQEIEFNDLPRYSPWCARIMGLEVQEVHYKTPEQIKREYNDEKWREICSILEKEPRIQLKRLEDRLFGDELSPIYLNKKFYLSEAKEGRKRLYALYREKMKPFFRDMECLVEMGSGYGSVILNLAPFVHEGGGKTLFGRIYS